MSTNSNRIGIDRAIGERFEIDGVTYECRAALDPLCKGCALFYEEENECLDRYWLFGHCAGNHRADGRDVKFYRTEDNGETQDTEGCQHTTE